MTEDVTLEVEVASVGVSEKAYFDAEGNETLRILHTTYAKKKNGSKVTFQGPEPFPWKIGDPLLVKVVTTQAHLDEFEEGKK